MDSRLPKRARSGDSSSCFSPPCSSPIDAVDQLLERLLEFPCSSVGNSIEKLMDYRISQSKEDVVERALQLGSTLVEAASRYARMLARKHNAESWSLPGDMTAKVLAMVDTQSLCHVAASCSLLNKCANDPSCYANIDLTSAPSKADDDVVYKMVQRAGKNLNSLKLGPLRVIISRHKNPDILRHSWFECLFIGDPHAGSLLRSFHLHNVCVMESRVLCEILLVCPALRDIEITDMEIYLMDALETISYNCKFMERLVLESKIENRRFTQSIKSITCHDFVSSCPNLTTLSLRRFKLRDHQVRILIEGFRKLKFVDFSGSYLLTGLFLRNLGCLNLLEDLILRDCPHFMEAEMVHLSAGLLAGHFKSLRTLDVSSKLGLATEDKHLRCYSTNNLFLAQLGKERPGLVVCANFPVVARQKDIRRLVPYEEFGSLSDPYALTSSSSEDEDEGMEGW